jgi:hypothetical protein
VHPNVSVSRRDRQPLLICINPRMVVDRRFLSATWVEF